MTPVGIFNGNSRHMQFARELEEEDRKRRKRFAADYMDAVNELRDIDPDFEAWYDGRPEQTCGEMLPLLVRRIAQIRAESAVVVFPKAVPSRTDEQRKFLERMNSPQMVARRGTYLTPQGWRSYQLLSHADRQKYAEVERQVQESAKS